MAAAHTHGSGATPFSSPCAPNIIAVIASGSTRTSCAISPSGTYGSDPRPYFDSCSRWRVLGAAVSRPLRRRSSAAGGGAARGAVECADVAGGARARRRRASGSAWRAGSSQCDSWVDWYASMYYMYSIVPSVWICRHSECESREVISISNRNFTGKLIHLIISQNCDPTLIPLSARGGPGGNG